MVQLTEKSVEDLRKMASKKKIKGRSKMNKTQLIDALSKKKKMIGGGLTNDEIDLLTARNYRENRMYYIGMFSREPNFSDESKRIISVSRYNHVRNARPIRVPGKEPIMPPNISQFVTDLLTIKYNLRSSDPKPITIIAKASLLSISNDGRFLIYNHPIQFGQS